MYNMDKLHSWQDRVNVLNMFTVKMLRSDYSENDMYTLVKSGVRSYEKMIERQESGVCPLYRPKGYERVQRWKNKILKRTSWSNAESTLFIPYGYGLKRVAECGIEKAGESVKVVERGGVTVKSLLQKSDPFREAECEDNGCPVCTIKEGGQRECVRGGCKIPNVGYVVTCIKCQEEGRTRVYEGESSRCLRIRAAEHLRDVANKNSNSGLYRHVRDEHNEVRPRMRFQVRRVFRDPLTRQVEEGVRISLSPEDQLVNTKNEWAPPALGRVRVE